MEKGGDEVVRKTNFNLIDYKYEQLLYKSKVYDAKQYINNTINKLISMEVDYSAIEKCSKEFIQGKVNWETEKFNKFKEDQKQIEIENFWDDNFDYYGVSTSYGYMLNKVTKSFMQNAHSYYDCLAQFINVALLGNLALSRNQINFSGLLNELKKNHSTIYNNVIQRMEKVMNSPNFSYIADVNNTLKHIHDISPRMKMSFIGSDFSLRFPSFSKANRRNSNHHNSVDLLDKMDEIIKELEQVTRDIISLVEIELKTMNVKYNKNRIHDIKYTLLMFDDPETDNQLQIFYETNDSIQNGDLFFVLHCKDNSEEIRALNCPYEEILVKNQTNELIGYLTPIEVDSNDDFSLLFYKGYKITLDSDTYTVYKHTQKHLQKNSPIHWLVMDGTRSKIPLSN